MGWRVHGERILGGIHDCCHDADIFIHDRRHVSDQLDSLTAEVVVVVLVVHDSVTELIK